MVFLFYFYFLKAGFSNISSFTNMFCIAMAIILLLLLLLFLSIIFYCTDCDLIITMFKTNLMRKTCSFNITGQQT